MMAVVVVVVMVLEVVVIALVGLPLEGRLGARRWMAVYILGLIGGNLAWWGSHMSSWTPALGASGACFGLLGAYLACWPNDRIAFPLIFLIREWPVGLVAVVRLGFEVYYVYGTQSGSMGSTNVAHLAHIGGFFLCFALGSLRSHSGVNSDHPGVTRMRAANSGVSDSWRPPELQH